MNLLSVDVGPGWTHRPGQVAELGLGPGSEGFFAIASAPWEGPVLRFLVKAGGSASAPLMDALPGTAIAVRGPFGRGFELSWGQGLATQPRELLLIGAGTALGAIRSALVDALAHSGFQRCAVLLGVRTEDALCLRSELAAWRARGVDLQVTLSTGSAPGFERGRVQAHLDRVLRAPASTLALIAGSEAFEDDVTAALVERGVPYSHIQRNYRADGRDLMPPMQPSPPESRERPRQESNL